MTTRVLARRALLGTATAALMSAAPALAQDDPEPAPSRGVLEEIIVTAQKRSENIQQVPASVSVLDGDSIQKTSAGSLQDYAAYLPGFNVTSGGSPGQVGLTLRGVAPVGPGSTVGTYIDDTPLGSSSNYARAGGYSLDLFPYDIERVEVLRGPQGTLYGASTMGGLLKYVTRTPDLFEVTARAGGEISSTDEAGDPNWGVRALLNVPVVSGRLAVQVSGYRQENAGYVDNVITGAGDTNPIDQQGARASLLWTVSDQVSLKLTALYQDIESANNSGVSFDPATDEPFGGPLGGRYFLDQLFTKEVRYYSATLDWDFDWATLTSATSHSDTRTYTDQDTTEVFGILFPILTGGAVPPGLSLFNLTMDLEKVTQEVRLTSPGGGRLEWMIGGFYTHEDSGNSQFITAQDFAGDPLPGLDPLVVVSLPTSYEEVAVFGNATLKLTDRFDVTAGLRWAKNEQDYRQILDGPLVGGPSDVPGASAEDVVTFMVSPRFFVSDDVTLYARVASGYRPGGPNVSLPGVPPTVKADTLVNYEAGVKSDWLDGRLLANVTAFLMDWDDIQISDSAGGATFLANGATARSQGLEVETALLVTDAVRLGVNAAYTDARFTADVPAVEAQEDDRLPQVPELSFSVTADYQFDVIDGWTGNLGGGYRWTGSRFSAPESAPTAIEMDSYGVADLYAGISNGRVSARLFVRNATNSRKTTTAVILTDALERPYQIDRAVLQPRTIGLSVDLVF